MTKKIDTKIVRTEARSLPVKLTDEELRERGDSLAQVIQNLRTEEDRQVDIKAQMKARLAELDAKKTQLAITISRREEDREVMVDTYHDYDRLKVEMVRQDTGETINSRRMTEAEQQLPLAMA